MPHKVIYVEWVDAHGGSGQYSLAEAEKSHTDHMASAGLLIKENEDFVVFAQDIFQYNDNPEQVRAYEVIPKVNITFMEVVDFPSEAKGVSLAHR